MFNSQKIIELKIHTWTDLQSYQLLEGILPLDPYQLWASAFYLLLWQLQHVAWLLHRLLFRQWYYSIGWPEKNVNVMTWFISEKTCCRMRFPLTDSRVAELRVMKKQLNLRFGSSGVGIGTHLPGSLQLHDAVQRQFAPVPYWSWKKYQKNDR